MWQSRSSGKQTGSYPIHPPHYTLCCPTDSTTLTTCGDSCSRGHFTEDRRQRTTSIKYATVYYSHLWGVTATFGGLQPPLGGYSHLWGVTATFGHLWGFQKGGSTENDLYNQVTSLLQPVVQSPRGEYYTQAPLHMNMHCW